MNKRILLVGLVVCFVLALLVGARANMRATRIRQGSDRKVTELMILAQQARDAGDMGNAELFWMHARELRPSLPRPLWLDRKPDVVSPSPPSPPEVEILNRIAELPYAQARLLLEEKLQQNPGDLKVRKLFLELAQRNGDHSEISRHKSLITHENSNSWPAWLWKGLGLLLLGLLVWQISALYRDFSH